MPTQPRQFSTPARKPFKIEEPNWAVSMIPVVGPAWEMAADIQQGDVGGALFNGAMLAADVLPGVGVAVRGARMAAKGVGVLKKGSLTANASQQMMRRKLGLVGKPEIEIHHTVSLNGIKRGEQNWRNHNLFLKALPKEQHYRLTRSYTDPVTQVVKPPYDPLRKAWYGTTDWQKAAAGSLAERGVTAAEKLRQQNQNRR